MTNRIVPCCNHPKNYITNFCQNQNCLLPLCPECVQIHVNDHKKQGDFPQFDTISGSLQQVEESLNDHLQQLEVFKKKVQDFAGGRTTQKTQILQELQRSQQSLIDVINNYFSGLRSELEGSININDEKIKQDLATQLHHIKERQDNLKKNYVDKIKDNTRCMEGLILFHKNQIQQRNDQFIQDFEASLQAKEYNQIGFTKDDSKIYEINVLLSRFISLQNKSVVFMNSQPQQQPLQQQMLPPPIMQIGPSPTKIMGIRPPPIIDQPNVIVRPIQQQQFSGYIPPPVIYDTNEFQRPNRIFSPPHQRLLSPSGHYSITSPGILGGVPPYSPMRDIVPSNQPYPFENISSPNRIKLN